MFQDLCNKYPDGFPDPVIEGMVEFEWDLYIDAKRKVGLWPACIVLTFFQMYMYLFLLIDQKQLGLPKQRRKNCLC